MVQQPSGTVTLVFTDIEGSTGLLQVLGPERYQAALAEHRRIMRAACARHDGYEVDYEGDSFFYAFGSAGAALAAVEQALRELQAGPIWLRVGLHTGEPGLDPPKYVGLDVHLAARVMAAAHGGQVLLTGATRELVEAELKALGTHRLKDISEAVALYQLGNGEFPPPRTLSRSNLPIPATAFLGRVREVGELLALLRKEHVRLLTLTGAGGSGKTRLALRVAAEQVEAFGDGVFFVSLQALADPELVLPEIERVLGSASRSARPPLARLQASLAGKQILLVLDNFELLSRRPICDRLPPVTTTGLHKGSMLSCLRWLQSDASISARAGYVGAARRQRDEAAEAASSRRTEDPSRSVCGLVTSQSPPYV